MSQSFNFSGVTLPTFHYSNSITDQFPNSNRSYKIESGIKTRYLRDHLPINGNLLNGTITDNYIEFILNSNQQEFFDLDSFTLELKIKIKKSNGDAITDTNKFTLIDGAGHRILSKSSVFLNGTPCENNAYFGLYNCIKSYTNMSKDGLSSIGRNMFYKDLSTKIFDKIDENCFTALSSEEAQIQSECKDIIHMMIPLQLDLSSASFYLLNGVDIRIRFDLLSPKVLINSLDNINYDYSIEMVKLWTQKIIPAQDALFSMNKNLMMNNSNIEYIFERPIIKSFVFSAGHSLLTLDNIFNGILPHKIYLFFIRQTSINGSYSDNAAYLTHSNISSIQLHVNGNSITSLNVSFPNQVASLFHHSLINLGNDKNLLALENFKHGRTIFVWDLRPSESNDVLPIEKSGNIRITVQTSIPLKENIIAFVVGSCTGLMEIDASKRVKTSYLM